MHIIQLGEPYQATVGILLSLFGNSGGPIGDPKKAAAIILQVADMEDPPLHLPLGSDAVTLICQADEVRLAELTTWEALSRSTDADDAVHRNLSKFA